MMKLLEGNMRNISRKKCEKKSETLSILCALFPQVVASSFMPHSISTAVASFAWIGEFPQRSLGFSFLSLVYSTRCRIVSLVVARFAQCISWWMGRGEGRGVGRVDLFSHTHFATLLLSLLSSLGSTFCPAQIPESASPATPHTPPPFTHPLSQHSVSFPAKFSLYTLFFSCTFLFRVRTKFNTLVVTCVARFFTYF